MSDTPLHAGLHDAFWAAEPLPLLCLDNFLPPAFAHRLHAEALQCQLGRKSNDYIFARNKYEDPDLPRLGPAGAALREMLVGSDFAATLSAVIGRDVFIDPDFVGGGLHRGGRGSFLDMHVDFGVHPAHPRWMRELNLLLYLNEGWEAAHGGHLDLRNSQTGATASIEPRFNRLVVMLTQGHTFHGYRRIDFPEGRFRLSIAAYAYSLAREDGELKDRASTTRWAPEQAGLLKRLAAAATPRLVGWKRALLGSATARRSRIRR